MANKNITLELKPTGQLYIDSDEYHLFVNGKEENITYYFYDKKNEMTGEGAHENILPQILPLPVSDFPDKLSIMHEVSYPLPHANIDIIDLTRKGKTFIISFGLYMDDEHKKKLFWNHVNYLGTLAKTARQRGLFPDRRWKHSGWDDINSIQINYHSTLSDTIGHKIKSGIRLLSETMKAADKEMLVLASQFLKRYH